MAATRTALGTDDLVGERWDLGIVGILGHVDETLMSARIAEAGGDKMMHAEMAHVA